MRAQAFADELRSLNGVQAVVSAGNRIVGSTLASAPAEPLPDRGDVKLDGTHYRVAGFPKRGFDGETVTVRQLLHEDSSTGPLSATSAIVVGVQLGFLILAFAFALTVSRTLQSEIQRLLVAAQRLGRGDFSVAIRGRRKQIICCGRSCGSSSEW